MAFKYIVLRAANRELPIIFPDTFTHSVVADTIKHMMVFEAIVVSGGNLTSEAQAKLFGSIQPVSAGEIQIRANCFGKSETLGLGSRGQVDTDLITGFPYFHGIVPEEE